MNAKKRAEKGKEGQGKHVTSQGDSFSCLQQSSLDDFLATAEMQQRTFEALHPSAVEVDKAAEVAKVRDANIARPELAHIVVPVPKRPAWDAKTTPEELHQAENDSFLAWRKDLAELEETCDGVTTPFERNLDFWRQLWRTIERSDVVVQILDARDPLFYRARDLEQYIRSFKGKEAVLVLNKADFLTAAEREAWTSYFKEQGIEMHLFSALSELLRLELLEAAEDEELPAHGNVEQLEGVLDAEGLMDVLEKHARELGVEGRPTIGMVGFPNVGKSSLINALVGGKKVSVSRQPGKTKHFQTLEVPSRELRFCDCPGLVFPSVVATKSHLLLRGVAPIDKTIDNISAVELIAQKIGADKMMAHYRCLDSAAPFRHEEPGRMVLSALAVARHHFLNCAVADMQWSAKRILQDYCAGDLLFVELPPGTERPEAQEERQEKAAEAAYCADIGLQDAEAFLAEANPFEQESLEGLVRTMSKRQRRQLQKGMARGKLLARNDGSLDPFMNQAQRLGSAAMGASAQRTFASGRR